MIGNYFKVAFRSITRHKGHTLINVFGLAIGIAVSLIIFLFVQDEFGYDRFHEDAENIFRVEHKVTGDGEESHWAATQGSLIPRLTERYPEIITGGKLNFVFIPPLVIYEDLSYYENHVVNADSTFFDLFNYKLIYGSKEGALSGTAKTVITESTSKKYFGNEDPIGKVLRVNDRNFAVTAVIEDVPYNSHFHFDIVLAMDDFRARVPQIDDDGPYAFYSYIRLPDEAAAIELKEKADKEIWELIGWTSAGDTTEIPEGYEAEFILNSVPDIHLTGHAEKEIEANSDIKYVYILSLIAIFVLLIACINYMNLSTAKSARRGKEVGIRKVLGAFRSNIVVQFIGESMLITLFSLLLALVLVSLFLPYFNDFTGKELNLDIVSNIPLLLILIGILLVVGFLSGSYPSAVLSSFNPLKVLISNTPSGANKTSLFLRRGLVIFQFSVSVLLIIGTITIYNQLSFIQDKKLGFDKENVVVLTLPGGNNIDNLEVLKNEIMQLPEIKSVCASAGVPGERMPFLTIRIPDIATENIEGNEEGDDATVMRVLAADEDVAETFGLTVKEGRTFSREISTDETSAFILNQAAVEYFNLENPLGMRFEYLFNLPEPKAGRIIGITENFHYASLHSEVEPLMIHVFPGYYRYLSVKLNQGDVKKSIQKIEQAWLKVNPGIPFKYKFLDTAYDNLYKTELNMGRIILYFTLLAILIASLGLLGLASHLSEQRTKEIGIRKVLGATIPSILRSLSKEFAILILIANVIAWIPAYYLLNNWLSGFAYRTELSILVFLVTSIMSFVIAILTVSSQTLRAARLNPSQALKYE